MNAQEIRELFKGYEVSLGAKDVWEVQGTPVIKHSALERLAAALKIRFDPPTVLRAERDEAVILTVGRLGDVSEWSVGEALVNVNYRVSGKMAAYVYAMAEKRSKDRVILKLANLHGAYSEEEADDFKNSAPAPARAEQAGGDSTPRTAPSADVPRNYSGDFKQHEPEDEPTESQRLIFVALGLAMEKASTAAELEEFKDTQIKPQLSSLTQKQQDEITALYKDRYRSIQRRAA